MILNIDKCHPVILGYTHKQAWANVKKNLIYKDNDAKFLGIFNDRY